MRRTKKKERFFQPGQIPHAFYGVGLIFYIIIFSLKTNLVISQIVSYSLFYIRNYRNFFQNVVILNI